MSSFIKTFELANRLAVKRGADYSAVRAPMMSREQMIAALNVIKDSITDDYHEVRRNLAGKVSELQQAGLRPETKQQVEYAVYQYRSLEEFIGTEYRPWLEDLINDLQTEAPLYNIDPDFVIPDNPVTKARANLAKIIYELRNIDERATGANRQGERRANVRTLFQSLPSVRELYRLAVVQENGIAGADVHPALEDETEEAEPYKQQWFFDEDADEPADPNTEREAGE